MAVHTKQRIRIIFREIRLHDNLEPPWDDEGEFRFMARISRVSDGTILQETKLPRNRKHYRITANPPWNQLYLNEVIFEGDVDDEIQVEIIGEEMDLLSPNDQLTPYRRTFQGPPSSWIGRHGPGDEGRGTDPEWMNDWWVYLDVEEA